MRRGETGRHERFGVGAARVDAFVPPPLPPDPPLRLEGDLHRRLEDALVSLGRLDGLATLLPDTAVFLYSYVRKEALLSSQIEGTRSSLSDLLLFELEEAPGVPLDDVVEVSNYVAALTQGLERIRAGFPFSARLVRDIHARLLARGRGVEKAPGEFRRTQNWIGGARPEVAEFVPPPANEVSGCMSALERFVNDERVPLPVLVKVGLTHAQFETIHPFLDGNGRVGRLLVPLLLARAGMLHEPLLYLSLFFKENRAEYYRLLGITRSDGDWEAWLGFFLTGVKSTADRAVASARRLDELFRWSRDRIRTQGRRAGSALRVHDVLCERPLLTLTEASSRTGLSFPAVSKAMGVLEGLDITSEITGRERNRVFAYDAYLAVLEEGTGPL